MNTPIWFKTFRWFGFLLDKYVICLGALLETTGNYETVNGLAGIIFTLAVCAQMFALCWKPHIKRSQQDAELDVSQWHRQIKSNIFASKQDFWSGPYIYHTWLWFDCDRFLMCITIFFAFALMSNRVTLFASTLRLIE